MVSMETSSEISLSAAATPPTIHQLFALLYSLHMLQEITALDLWLKEPAFYIILLGKNMKIFPIDLCTVVKWYWLGVMDCTEFSFRRNAGLDE